MNTVCRTPGYRQTNIDLVKFANKFETLNNILDGIDSELNYMNEIRAEMETEYRAEMEAEYYAEML